MYPKMSTKGEGKPLDERQGSRRIQEKRTRPPNKPQQVFTENDTVGRQRHLRSPARALVNIKYPTEQIVPIVERARGHLLMLVQLAGSPPPAGLLFSTRRQPDQVAGPATKPESRPDLCRRSRRKGIWWTTKGVSQPSGQAGGGVIRVGDSVLTPSTFTFESIVWEDLVP